MTPSMRGSHPRCSRSHHRRAACGGGCACAVRAGGRRRRTRTAGTSPTAHQHPALLPVYRDIEELLAERGVEVDHVTVYRWVQRFTPLQAEAARPCRHRAGDRWFVDETYVKVAGRWRYLYRYRAIDQFGQVIDVLVSPQRDAKAARRFFEQAIATTKVAPVEVVTD
jgi:hypothetical protein